VRRRPVRDRPSRSGVHRRRGRTVPQSGRGAAGPQGQCADLAPSPAQRSGSTDDYYVARCSDGR
jgi:hypothetical protein